MSDKSPPVTASLGLGLSLNDKRIRDRKAAPAASTKRQARILLVDGDSEMRRLMTTRLIAGNYIVESVDTAEAALEACLRARPAVVISDLRLPGISGLEFLKELKIRWPAVAVIIVTAHATIADAVEATQSGAFGFLVAPVEKAELLGQVGRAIAASSFTLVEGEWRSDIVARSQLMEDRLTQANRAAANPDPVLLTGENGTGKELLARAIHAASPRRKGPFVAVHCNAANEAALEVELGGALRSAAGGTLLLNEVAYLSPRLQGLLATALTGRSHAVPDIRIISTSSRDLKALLDGGDFRSDLYYYLNILPIEIPPLGRRREDIPLLVSHFLERATEPGDERKIYTPEAIDLLATSDWPGNVRQLFELVKKNVELSHTKIMSKEFVARSLGDTVRDIPSYDEARDKFARTYLAHNLQAAAGNITQAARLAKRNRTDFYKLLARYRVDPAAPRADAAGTDAPAPQDPAE